MGEEAEVTHDTLLRGRVKLLQPRSGYRSSLDPVLLAGFLNPPFGTFLDIGCATGALSFLMLARDPAAAGVAVEIQPRLAQLAEQGRAANGFQARLRIVPADVRTPGVVADQSFDLVATNPPFRPVGTGILPPISERALAHHEVTLTLADWLDVAGRVLRPGGRVATIFPFDRWDELRVGLAARGMPVTRWRWVLPHQGEPPGRVLVEACRGSRGGRQEASLVVHDRHGYTAEVRAMLGEET